MACKIQYPKKHVFCKANIFERMTRFSFGGFFAKIEVVKDHSQAKTKDTKQKPIHSTNFPKLICLVSSKNSTQHPNNFYPFQKKRRSVRSSQGRTVRSAASSNVARSQGSPLLRLRTVPKKKMRK